jgi:antitoxin ParD1/3/4
MAREVTLNVSLTPPLRQYIQKKVRTGGYASASEVVRESLRALQERDRAGAAFWAGLREKVSIARRQVEAGQVVDGDEAMDDIIAELPQPPRRRRKQGKAKG